MNLVLQNDHAGVQSLLETERGRAAINTPNLDGLTPLVSAVCSCLTRMPSHPFLAVLFFRHTSLILGLTIVQLLSFSSNKVLMSIKRRQEQGTLRFIMPAC